MSDVKINCQQVWKVFGPTPEKIIRESSAEMNRADILAKTGHVVGVRNVSFTVQEGEVFCVMGLSGSGKSTLIRCLTRLIEPTSGNITINGQDVLSLNSAELRKLRRTTVSMVFQRFGLFTHRRVLDNVSYGLEVQGWERQARHRQAYQFLDLVGLREWANHFPHELSGGMQQRVGLARALAVNPQILLCDEPFSALDPLIRREMQNELLRLQANLHKTILFITHDFLEAVKLGARIAIMKDGEIVQIGTPQEIIARPINEYVREFTKDVPRANLLTAATIAQPAHLFANVGERTVSAETSLAQLIPMMADSTETWRVIDSKSDSVGCVNRHTLLLALAEGA